jgi:hypothetical protein
MAAMRDPESADLTLVGGAVVPNIGRNFYDTVT